LVFCIHHKLFKENYWFFYHRRWSARVQRVLVSNHFYSLDYRTVLAFVFLLQILGRQSIICSKCIFLCLEHYWDN
jgi:hypothetical protein